MSRTAALTVSLFLILTACAFQDTKVEILPSWTAHEGRMATADTLIFVESEDHVDKKQALFLAEATGLSDIANECGGIPSGTKTETYSRLVQNVNEAYVQVRVSLADCQKVRAQILAGQEATVVNKEQTLMVHRLMDEVGESRDGRFQLELTGQPEPISDDTDYFIVRERLFITSMAQVLAPTTAAGAPIGGGVPMKGSLTAYEVSLIKVIEAYEKTHEHELGLLSKKSWTANRRNLLRQHVEITGPQVVAPPPPRPGSKKPGTGEPKRRRRRIDVDSDGQPK